MEAQQIPASVNSSEDVFIPQEKFYGPCDITLLVKDGIVKAHKKNLSKSSDFFESLLNSNMRERNEGIVRFETLSKADLGDVLEFIYTGSVDILSENHAKEIIAIADYMLIQQLKYLAGRFLANKLNVFNCIPTYYFAQRFQCKELFSDTWKFIVGNFTAVAKTKEFLDLAVENVEIWISSDEINVSAEEDVFKILLTWIDHDKSERKKCFETLFNHLRLPFVTRDYLHRDIMTNDLVRVNERCLDLVEQTLEMVDSKNYDNLSISPRKSLEIPVILVCEHNLEDQLLCYFPRDNSWCKLRETSPLCDQVISCHGKLYFLSKSEYKLLRYDSFSNRWSSLSYKGGKDIQQLFVRNDDEIYAYATENSTSCPGCVALRCSGTEDGVVGSSRCGKKHFSHFMKYKAETNFWEEISSFDVGSREGICIVAEDSFIYFVGGRRSNMQLKDADRYDLDKTKWDKIPDMQKARQWAYGAVAHGRLFITDNGKSYHEERTCEVYLETTNEWQFIASLRIPRTRQGCMMCVDGKLYVLNDCVWSVSGTRGKIECYDPDKDEWREQTEIPLKRVTYAWYLLNSCSMRVFKGGYLHWPRPSGCCLEHSKTCNTLV